MGTKTRALTGEEMARYMAVLNDPPAGSLPYAAICAVILGTGARVGEVLAMRGKDLFEPSGKPREELSRDIEKRRRKKWLTPAAEKMLKSVFLALGIQYRPEIISEALGKISEKKVRPLRLTTPFPWEQLGNPVIRWREYAKRHYLRTEEHFLFSVRYSNTPVNRRSVLRANERFLIRAGIDPRGVGLHGERKTFLRLIYARLTSSGMRELEAARHIQKLAGHARLETTILYLFDDIRETRRQAIMSAFQNHAQN